MNTYQRVKAKIRSMAVEYQNSLCDKNYSYGELAYWQDYFERMAKKYGLVREFRENGII